MAEIEMEKTILIGVYLVIAIIGFCIGFTLPKEKGTSVRILAGILGAFLAFVLVFLFLVLGLGLLVVFFWVVVIIMFVLFFGG
jgi:lipopolysaccharide export LptBFGC system permease protein LptF